MKVTARRRVNRVETADLEYESVRIEPEAGVLMHQVGALARGYFGSIDRRDDVEKLLRQLDPNGFKLQVLSPDRYLATADDYREWYSGVLGAFNRLHHTIVALDAELVGSDKARAKLTIHSELDLLNPAEGEHPRASYTLDIVWDLSRTQSGWVISEQHAASDPTANFSIARARQFATVYLHSLDRRDLDSMLSMLAPQDELNIALNGGLIIEDFPAWFRMIDDTFIKSDHRIQGLVPLENVDGTIDVHLKIHFTAERRNPGPDEDKGIDFSVERIWTIHADSQGAPQLVSQRPFAILDQADRLDPMDLSGALAATRRGDNEIVRDWLRNGGDANAYAADGFNLFLASAATGNAEVLRMLLTERVGKYDVDPALPLKDPQRPEYDTRILGPHLAAQKGDVVCTMLLLSRSPDQLHTRIEVNGHTPLLQAAFYGHVELASAIVGKLESILPDGADVDSEMLRLFSETTVRGINATQFGRQFNNQAMIDALEPFDHAGPEDMAADTKALLEAIPAGPRHPEAGTPAQAASEAVIEMIGNGLLQVAGLDEAAAPAAVSRIIGELEEAVGKPDFDPNRLAGDLLQTPIIAAVTGTNANESVASLRNVIVDILLEKGADPDKEELYPMAVDAVIRAAVFNHFEALKKFEAAMETAAMKDALNHKPAVNGLTALHDSVLRAATGADGYLEQIRWARGLGVSADIEDHTGRSQRDFAAAAFITDGQKENAAAVWEALQLDSAPPKPYQMFSYDNLTFLTIPDAVADKGTVWRTLSSSSDAIVKSINLIGPNALSAEVVQNHSFGTALFNRHWPDGRPVDAKEVQAFAAQTRGTPFLPMMRFEKSDPYIKQLLGAGLFGALLVDPKEPEDVRALLRDTYFPERPNANTQPMASTAEHPLGKRAVGADNIAQRTFAEYPKMMDTVNDMFIGGVSFSKPAAAGVLKELAALKTIGVKMIEVDRDGIRSELAGSCSGSELDSRLESAVLDIENAAKDADIVLSGKFSTDAEILSAFERGYRHITTISEEEAHVAAWRTWVPEGRIEGREPLPREMPVRPPSRECNDIRRALGEGQLVVFGALTTPNLETAVALAKSGILNAVAIEREHGTWSTEEAVRHIKVLREHTSVMLRICSALDEDIGTFVELGAEALIATAVQGAVEARHFLSEVEKANIRIHGEDNKAMWTVPVCMMETEAAADDTEEIVAMLKEQQGVCHPGPLDLSASLGAAWGTAKYESTLSKIESAAKKAGVPLAGVLNTLEASLAHGFGMVLAPVAMDGGALNAGIMGLNPLESLQKDNSA